MPRKRKSTARLARQVVDIAVAAPLVIAARTTRMALAGSTPSAKDRREFERMHSEKLAAFQDVWAAMWTESLRLQQQAALSMMGGWWKPTAATKLLSPVNLQRNALSIMGKGVAPVRHTAVANAKRLLRPKR